VLELQVRGPIQPTKKACKALCGTARKALYITARGSAWQCYALPNTAYELGFLQLLFEHIMGLCPCRIRLRIKLLFMLPIIGTHFYNRPGDVCAYMTWAAHVACIGRVCLGMCDSNSLGWPNWMVLNKLYFISMAWVITFAEIGCDALLVC
jgi:hypothetical protein